MSRWDWASKPLSSSDGRTFYKTVTQTLESGAKRFFRTGQFVVIRRDGHSECGAQIILLFKQVAKSLAENPSSSERLMFAIVRWLYPAKTINPDSWAKYALNERPSSRALREEYVYSDHVDPKPVALREISGRLHLYADAEGVLEFQEHRTVGLSPNIYVKELDRVCICRHFVAATNAFSSREDVVLRPLKETELSAFETSPSEKPLFGDRSRFLAPEAPEDVLMVERDRGTTSKSVARQPDTHRSIKLDAGQRQAAALPNTTVANCKAEMLHGSPAGISPDEQQNVPMSVDSSANSLPSGAGPSSSAARGEMAQTGTGPRQPTSAQNTSTHTNAATGGGVPAGKSAPSSQGASAASSAASALAPHVGTLEKAPRPVPAARSGVENFRYLETSDMWAASIADQHISQVEEDVAMGLVSNAFDSIIETLDRMEANHETSGVPFNELSVKLVTCSLQGLSRPPTGGTGSK